MVSPEAVGFVLLSMQNFCPSSLNSQCENESGGKEGGKLRKPT
jgi:hypothetical protein